jgi:hypothetical protein
MIIENPKFGSYVISTLSGVALVPARKRHWFGAEAPNPDVPRRIASAPPFPQTRFQDSSS